MSRPVFKTKDELLAALKKQHNISYNFANALVLPLPIDQCQNVLHCLGLAIEWLEKKPSRDRAIRTRVTAAISALMRDESRPINAPEIARIALEALEEA